MQNLLTNKSSNPIKVLQSTIALAMVFSFVFIFATSAKAAPFDQPPVPTFSPVSSNGDVTTATVPANLIKEWRGFYSRPATSLLTNTFDGNDKSINKATLREFLLAKIFKKSLRAPVKTYKFNPAAVYAWTNKIADSVNAQASEPAMKIEDGRVTEFTPPQTGKALDRYNSALKIIKALSQGNDTVDLVVNTTEPKTSLASLNKLGIKELIGRGESKFNGSPANRRWNIKVGVKRMAGVIVKPGEEFSFNKYLGPVEASTGFKPELVIKGDQGTIPEFGGGLCQVSSTTFRAAMHAGLPITARRNHSYAVQYYAPQGTDATIYPGSADLKFKNDTGNSILIWPYFKDENYLIFDFYGTYDGRKVELGTPYSYDKKSDGSMKATWTRTVIKNGVSKDDVFNSVYQPPAKFHKTEGFASGTTSPTTPVLAPPTGTTDPNSNTNSNTNTQTPPTNTTQQQ